LDKLDKAKKKAMLEAWGKKNKESAQATFPLEDALLNIFFTQIEMLMHDSGCFHDTRNAQKIIDESLKLTDDKANSLLDWCAENGGYCDCEIAANTMEYWEENRTKK
jgi:Protein of unknown function (DUF2695)